MAGPKPAAPTRVDGIIFTVAVADQTGCRLHEQGREREERGRWFNGKRRSGAGRAGLLSAHRLCHTKEGERVCYATMSLAFVVVCFLVSPSGAAAYSLKQARSAFCSLDG